MAEIDSGREPLRGLTRMGARLLGHWKILLACSALGTLILAVDPLRLLRALERLRPLSLGELMLAVLAFYFFKAMGWRSALVALGIPASRRRTVLATFGAQTASLLPLGSLSRVVLLGDSREIDYGAVTASIAFQELLLLILMALASIPGMIRFPQAGVIAGAMLLATMAAFATLLWRPLYDRAVDLVGKVPYLGRFEGEIRNLPIGFRRLLQLKVAIRLVAWNAISLACAFGLFFVALRAIGVTQVTFARSALVFSVSYMLGALSLLPGGLGAYEATMTGFLVLMGIAAPLGAAAALVYRGFNDGFMALVGLASLRFLNQSPQHTGPGPDAREGDIAIP